MELKIRKATLKDSKIANSFLTKLIQDEKKYDKNINENCVVQTLYENIIPNEGNCILLAELDNKIVGYLYGYIENIGDAYLESIAMLDAMFVNGDARNKGIGNKLIEGFEKWAKENNVKYIELKVCNENDSAVALYRKNKFNGIKTIMIKELEN